MEACCDVDTRSRAAATCPACARPGRAVAPKTVAALVRAGVEPVRLTDPGYRFCETSGCPVVYYSPGGVRIERDALRVPVHQKDGGGDVPLCYCFGYTRERLAREGESAVAFVSGEVKAGRCACEVENPSGRCCLGDLRRFLRVLRTGPVATAAVPAERTEGS